MLSVIGARTPRQFAMADRLAWDYLEWANGKLREVCGVDFDIKALHAQDIRERAKYLPPDGRLLLALLDGHAAGCLSLKRLDGGVGELKRMYVRPEFRNAGIGKALVGRAIDEARAIGYRCLRLDSNRFMEAAHAVYRGLGFYEREPYPGSEIPLELQPHWLFMELPLGPAGAGATEP